MKCCKVKVNVHVNVKRKLLGKRKIDSETKVQELQFKNEATINSTRSRKCKQANVNANVTKRRSKRKRKI